MKYFYVLILFQLCLILFLGGFIYKKSHNTLNAVSINPINKKNIVFSPSEELSHYYELPPNKSIVINEKKGPNDAFYTINSDTLNERYDYMIEKDSNTYRIITLGDSFTFGLYVDTKDNWTERLEDILNSQLKCKNIDKFEVINLGVGAYDIIYSVERYKRRGMKYTPDLVLWLFVDAQRIDEEMLPRAEKIEQSSEFQKNKDRLSIYYPHSKAQDEYTKEYGFEKIAKYQKTSLELFNNYYKGKLFLLLSPWFSKQEKAIFYQNKNKNIKTLNILDSILTDEDSIFKGDGHPNQNGHQKIAETLFKYLTDQKVISCK